MSLPLAPCLRPATKPFSSLFILGKGKGLWGWLCWCGRLCYCLCSQPSTAQSNEHAEYPRSSLFKNIYLRRGTPFHSEQHLRTGFALAAKEAWNSRKLLKTNLLLKFPNRNTPLSPSLGNKTPLFNWFLPLMYLNHYLQRRELKLGVEARMTSSTINTMPFIIEKKANGES